MKNLRNIGIATITLGAVATLVILMSTTSFAGDFSDILTTLGFYLWVMLPFAVLFIATLLIDRKRFSSAAQIAILFTSILVVLSSVLIYWFSMFKSESSTSALVFLFIPLYGLAAIGIVYLFGWLLLRLLMPESRKT